MCIRVPWCGETTCPERGTAGHRASTEFGHFRCVFPGSGAGVVRVPDTHTHRFSAKSRIDSRKALAVERGEPMDRPDHPVVQPIVIELIIHVVMN